jgi:hypothetical protein
MDRAGPYWQDERELVHRLFRGANIMLSYKAMSKESKSKPPVDVAVT